jgi:hypothetical protein
MSYLSNTLLGGGETRLSTAHRATHTYVIGQPSTGKSRALESWALQDIGAGHGVAVIDPHGDLFRNILTHLAMQPKLWPRVVIIDPCDRRWVVGFNPLSAMKGMSQERVASFLTDIITKIWRLDTTTAPRLVWLLNNTFQALAGLGLTLLDLPRFLLDADYRQSLLPRVPSASARTYFEHEYPDKKGLVHQWVTPVLNKLGAVIDDPDMRLMVAGSRPLDFREAMDRKLILLVHLPKGVIGEGTSALLGAFIVANLQKAALARTDAASRPPYYLYLDEFQNYTTDNIQDILSESRKYNLSLTLAHQYLDQLSNELRSAVVNTVGTLSCFRVGYHDGLQLAKEVFPAPDFLSRNGAIWPMHSAEHGSMLDIGGHVPHPGWDGLAQQIAGLRPREFWMRRRGPGAPHKLRTLDVPDVSRTGELVAAIKALRDTSGQVHGVRKEEALQRTAARNACSKMDTTAGRTARDNGSMTDIPAWGN